ncbi:MAG TPA: hypothetical protein VHB77_20930, partial [Planctomycetaceae bacterium]|nr:hypothetical protein [Planctomycetaceae bacterium]
LMAYYCILYAPIPTTRGLTRLEMEMVRTEATMPLLWAGCALGALGGWRAERRLAGRMTLSVAVILLGLVCVIVDEIGRALLSRFSGG